MSESNVRRFEPLAASLLLAGAMCVIPFLQPRHFPPLRTFYDEWLALALGLSAASFAVTARSSAAVRVPSLTLWLGAFALFLPVRAFFVPGVYVQSSVTWSLYALCAACLIALGHALATQFGRERVCDVLAAALLFGALANAGVAVLQVTSIPPSIDAFVATLHGARAIGNIGQANLFANYLALGEASLLYLYARNRINAPAALAGALVLAASAALAASRSSALYAAWFALLGCLVIWRGREASIRRLGHAAAVLAIGSVLVLWLAPAALNALGVERAVTLDRWRGLSQEAALDPGTSSQLRVLAWGLAWRLFAADPWLGIGPGEFAGAAFARGIPPEMAAEGIWTSPHNFVLQLLAETGLIGAALVAAGLIVWLRRSASEFRSSPSLALWWVAACTGVEFIHALLEFPFWYAHFLGVTALAMGISAAGSRLTLPSRAMRWLVLAGVMAAAAMLSIAIRDYMRLDLAGPVAAGRTLAPEPDVLRERSTLRDLSGGLLAPRSDVWRFLALPLDAEGLEEKLAIGARVLRVWPSSEVLARQSIFLALAGRGREALALLARGRETYTHPQRQAEIAAVLAAAPREALQTLPPN